MPNCELCGEPMPPGEEMFKFHGYSGDCPKPPAPRAAQTDADVLRTMEKVRDRIVAQTRVGLVSADPANEDPQHEFKELLVDVVAAIDAMPRILKAIEFLDDVDENERVLEAAPPLPDITQSELASSPEGLRAMLMFERASKHFEIAQLRAWIERMRAAIAPFAAVTQHDIGTLEGDGDYFQPMTTNNRAPRLRVGDFRRLWASEEEPNALSAKGAEIEPANPRTEAHQWT